MSTLQINNDDHKRFSALYSTIILIIIYSKAQYKLFYIVILSLQTLTFN